MDNSMEFRTTGLMLHDVLGPLVAEVHLKLRNLGEADLAEQIKSIFIPVQDIDGSESRFSVLAYTTPRLDFEAQDSANV